MWVSRKKFELLETKIAALEKEQIVIKKYVENNIKSDQELIVIVKNLHDDIKRLN